MDDIGKALIMAMQVLMFAVAATVSIYLYSTITNSIDKIMLSDNYSNKGDSIVGVEGINADRRLASRSEIIMAILALKPKEQYDSTMNSRVIVRSAGDYFIFTYSSGDNSIAITRNGSAPVKEVINSLDLRLALDNYIQDDDYILTYNEDIKTLRYTQN